MSADPGPSRRAADEDDDALTLDRARSAAKTLLKRCRAGDAAALGRVRRFHADAAPDAVALHAAQLAVAREQGFPSWPKLVEHLEPREPSRGDREDASHGYEIDGRGMPDLIDPALPPRIVDAIRAGDSAGVAALWASDNFRGDPLHYWLRRLDERAVSAFIATVGAAMGPHVAAGLDAVGVLSALLDSDAALARATDAAGRTPLDYAAHNGHAAATKMVLSRGADARAGQPLLWAAQNGFVGPVRLLLDAGADANRDGSAVLDRAAYRNRPRVVRLLLARGARPGPASLAAAAYGSRSDRKLHVLQALVDYGADVRHRDKRGMDALYSQIWFYGDGPDERITRFLIDAGCEPDVFSSAGLDLVDELRRMIDAEPSLVSARSRFHAWTPLHFAAVGNAYRAAELLLSRGADAGAVAERDPYAPAARAGKPVRPIDLVRARDGAFVTADTEPLRQLL